MHGRYSRAEMEAAFGILTAGPPPAAIAKAWFWHQSSATDLLFVNLRKSEALFSPSTRYRDLGLSTRFLPAAGH